MKKLLASVFRRFIQQGQLTVHWPDATTTVYGQAGAPRTGVRITDWRTVRRLAANPGLAFGEAYMDATLQPVGCDIYDLLDLVMCNVGVGMRHPVLRYHQAIQQMTRTLKQLNTAPRARRHVAHHYDLDSRLYRLILDEDLQYSCAYFRTGTETLEAAQQAKKRLIASKLRLTRPGLRVLDIGCGWGGLALTLAAEHGAEVTGITLSTEQLAIARARAAAAGLADRVRFELTDYRAVAGRFDRVVSVGMMEHVGLLNYHRFFRLLHDRLAPDGVALIHHIGRSAGPGSTAAWLEKYIFPGGYSPALSEVAPAIEASGLMITDLEVWRLHYAQTIAHWRARLAANRAGVLLLTDERFCRMFEFYFAAAELAFRREREVVFQFQLSPCQEAVPPTRDYMLG